MTDIRQFEASGEARIDGQPIDAPIRSVLVLEDRAQVTRQAELTLSAGIHSLAVSPATPLVADRSLRCRLRPNDMKNTGDRVPAQILDLQVRRSYLTQATQPERQREITSAIEKLEDAYLEALDVARAGFHRRQFLGHTLKSLAQQMCDRLLIGDFDESWPEEIRCLFDSRAEVEKGLLNLQWQQNERLRRLERLAEERRLSLQPEVDYQASLLAQIGVHDEGMYTLGFEYQVPCALWRPEYTAELQEKDGRTEVKWQSAGTVWQATGEDWHQVALKFSTARPTLGAEMPMLQDDLLSMRDKSEQEKKVIEVSSRNEVIARTSELPEAKQTDTPPGLDDGGETRTYVVPKCVDVPSDGRAHRIEFERWESEAEAALIAVPEKAEFVFLRSFVTNPSAMPLLAGPVHLMRNGGYIGCSRIGYVAPGERFAMSWGSQDDLVVLRRTGREFEETELRKRKIHRYNIEVYLSNQSGGDRAIQVCERLPISEIEQVEVGFLENNTTRGFKKDAQGLVCWDVKLSGGGETRLCLSFRVSMPHNVEWNC